MGGAGGARHGGGGAGGGGGDGRAQWQKPWLSWVQTEQCRACAGQPHLIGADLTTARRDAQLHHLPSCCCRHYESTRQQCESDLCVQHGRTFPSRRGGGVVACKLVQAPAEEAQFGRG